MKWLRLLVWLMLAAASGAQAQIAFRAAAQASVAVGGTGGITFVGASANAASRNNCGNINPAIPGGNVDDVLIALVNARENGATVTMTGWNEAYGHIFPGGTEMQVKVYWRLATGTDPNTVTQSGTCSSIGAQIARFRGVDTTQPLETDPIPDATNVQRQTNANNVDTGTQTTTVADSMLLVAAFLEDDRTVTQGAGWSQAFDSAVNVMRDLGLSLHHRLEPTVGTFSVSNWNHSGGSADNYGIIFALRPASPASPLTINVPAGTVANDVMIASITMRPCSNSSGGACTTTINEPAGWTQVGTTIDQETGAGTGGFGHRLAVYRRVASGAEPASYTWSFGGTPVHAGAAGAILSFSGVDTTNPIIANAGQTTGVARTHIAPSVDTGSETNAMLVTTHTVNSSGAWGPPPAGMTEQADIASLGTPDDLGLSLGVYTQSIPAAGPTGTRTATQPLTPNPAYDTGATYSLALRPGSTVAHYSIGASATTVANCDYVEVAIVGHDASHTTINVPSGRTVTLTTSTGTGVWQALLVSGGGTWVPSGANNGTATYTWPGGESGFTVRLRQSAVASLSINLNDGAATEGGGLDDPTISFVNSALRISNGGNAALAIGTQIAGKPSDTGFGAQSLFLQAIRTDTSTGACVSLFPKGGDVSVDVRAQCNNPATCTQNLSINSSAAASNSRTFVPGTAFGAMNFRFTTDNGEAPFVLSYADAGQLTLEFRAALPSPPANQLVQGTSNAFVTRPFGFRITGANSATPLVTSAAPAPADPVLAVAGANFNVTVTAVQWKAGDDTALPAPDGVPDSETQIAGNAVTPNFGQEAVAASVALTHSLNAPAAGDPGTLGGSTTFSGFAAGTKTQGVSWSEVGFINLAAATTSPYLGTVNVTNSAAGLTGVGRFRPDHLFVSASTLTNRAALACASTFSYMGEGVGLAFTLQARNAAAAPAVTRNYTTASGYARLDPTAAAQLGLGAIGVAPGSVNTNLTPRVLTALGNAATFVNGQVAVATTVEIRRGALPANDDPDGPFTNTRFGAVPSELAAPNGDSVTLRTSELNLDVDGAGGSDRVQIGSPTELRYGVLRMDNAVGAQTMPLPTRVEAVYWGGPGVGFRRNTEDGCTQVARQNFSLGPYTGNLNACETVVSPASATLAGGVAALSLDAPGAGNDGTVVVTLNLAPTPGGNRCDAVGGAGPAAVSAAMGYLLGRSNDAASAEAPDVPTTRYDDNPSSRAAFGLFGGQPNNFIYFRENY